MPLYTQDGNRLSLTEFDGLCTTASKTTYTLGTDVYETYGYDSEDTGDAFTSPDGYRLKFPAGTQFTQEQHAALYKTATVDTVAPATGSAAGGTAITVTGTNFTIGSTVTVGGTACTSVVVATPTKITCVTPAKTAGAYAVAVTTDTGAASKSNAFTTS